MIVPSLNLFHNTKINPVPTTEDAALFGPISKSRSKVGIAKDLFSRTGSAFSIISASASTPFLLAKSNGMDLVVLGDVSGVPVATIEKKNNTTFTIYNGTKEQEPYCQVTSSGKVLCVVINGKTINTIHKVVPHPSRTFGTKHTIRKADSRREVVASTLYGKGNSYILSIEQGNDAYLMTCLAVIANQVLVD